MTLAGRSPWLRAASAICALCALASMPPGGSKRDWIERLSAAGTSMESALPAVVADEQYDQRRDGVRASPDAQRTLVSEFGWLQMPELGETIGVRDIRTVDGEPVSNNEVRLHDLLAGRSSNAAADVRALLATSARHNLGEVERNFNFPTFPLIYLRPANRDRSKWAVDSSDPSRVVVRFEERDRPTLVRSQQSADVPAVGSCRLDGRLFALEQCTVTLKEERVHGFDRALTYSMSVDFAEDVRLAIRVPVEMRDDLLIRFRQSKTDQRIVGTARYHNYRRFETSGRLVRP